MAFQHNSKTRANEPPWSEVDKTALPRIAFADMGDSDKKSTWKYPHHWVYGGTKKNDQGIWEDGELFLHLGGLRTAWASANGARSGQEAPESVKEHLRQHRKAIGANIIGDWLILPDWLERLSAVYNNLDIDAIVQSQVPTPPALSNVIEIIGPIWTYSNIFTMLGIGTSVQEISSKLDSVSGDVVYLFIDSPGGQVTGINALARKIRDLDKKVVAYIYGLGASAAYWIASAADKVYADATALVGSIGVVATYMKTFDDNVIIITNSKSPDKVIDVESDDGKSKIVALLDGIAEVFIKSVAEFRGTSTADVEEKFGRGGVLLATDALAVGMIDDIKTFEEVIMEEKIVKEFEELKAQYEQVVTTQKQLEAVNEQLKLELFRRDIEGMVSDPKARELLMKLYGHVAPDTIVSLATYVSGLLHMIEDLGGRKGKPAGAQNAEVSLAEAVAFAKEHNMSVQDALVELMKRR